MLIETRWCNYLLPLYFGTQRTAEVRPLILKCLPSNSEHCCSRKSFLPFGHESVLHDRNFILRPTQYFPSFLGLKKKVNVKHTHFLTLLFSTKGGLSHWPKEENLTQYSVSCVTDLHMLSFYCAFNYPQNKPNLCKILLLRW